MCGYVYTSIHTHTHFLSLMFVSFYGEATASPNYLPIHASEN